MKSIFTILMMAVLAAPAGAQTPSQNGAADVKLQATRCDSCHGNPQSGAPRLNGQSANYILLRLQEFQNLASQTPHATESMWDMSSSMGAVQARAVANYFAQLEPTQAHPLGLAVGEGRKLYLASCQSCHGAQGEGGNTAPRLAGQRPAYLKQQMAAFGLSVRYHRSMVENTIKLSPQQIDSLAAYLGAD